MRKAADALRGLGVAVDESFADEPDASGYDLAHVFNLRTIQYTRRQVEALKRSGVPVVLSPIYLDPGTALWALHAVPSIFAADRPPEKLAGLLRSLRTRTLKLGLPDGRVATAGDPNRDPAYDQSQRDILARVDHLVPNSLLEMAALVKTLRVPVPPFTVAPYAADARDFLDPDPDGFVKQYGVRDFVLQVGRIEPSKNQLMLAYALRDAGVPVVLIGGQLVGEYLEAVRKFGPPDLTVIPHLSTEQLRSAYAAARVHALPSWVETCGLVSLEAALADCNLVVSTAGYELEYFRDLAYYCDPADSESIRAAVLAALTNYPQDAGRRAELKRLILTEYTWERAAAVTLQAYERTLGASPARGTGL